jgi:hypothetical protein
MTKYLSFFILLAVTLAACGNSDQSSNSLADELPLDPQKPTFVFFYTHN